MAVISLADFQKFDLRIGGIETVEEMVGFDKLYKIEVDFGKEKRRNLIAGIKPWYSADELVGRKIVVVLNLKPKKMGGVISEGMLLAADVDGRAVLVVPEKDVEAGAIIR